MPKSLLRARPSGDDLDRVFHALADPTRRSVVERLGQGPAATSVLAKGYPMALPSFIQHLDVLEASGLVRSHKDGRVRTYALVASRLDHAQGWLDAQRDLWNRRLDQLDAFLVGDPDGSPTPSTHTSTHTSTHNPTHPTPEEHPE